MDYNKMPACLCGNRSWDPSGGSFSPYMSQHGYRCPQCNRYSMFLCNSGGHIFLMPLETGSQGLSESSCDWLNKVLVPTWRHNGALLDAARESIVDSAANAAKAELDILPDAKIQNIPEEKRTQLHQRIDAARKSAEYAKPPGVVTVDIPPALPEDLVAYQPVGKNGDEIIWKRISWVESSAVPIPPDPIRVRHDAWFAEIFAALRTVLNHDVQTTHIPNEYGSSSEAQPWFAFTLGKNSFKVGPRKRVDSIKVEAPDGIWTRAIRKAAAEANVTYEADGGWKSEIPIAHSLEVHSDNKGMLIQFLIILGKESLEPTDPSKVEEEEAVLAGT